MAGGKSTYLDNSILNRIFGGVAWTAPATLYIGVFTTAPSAGGSGGVEVSASGYARLAAPANQTNFPAASSGSISNGVLAAWPAATANWGTVAAVGIFDAATAGNLLYWAPCTNNPLKSIGVGDVLQFPVGQLTFTES